MIILKFSQLWISFYFKFFVWEAQNIILCKCFNSEKTTVNEKKLKMLSWSVLRLCLNYIRRPLMAHKEVNYLEFSLIKNELSWDMVFHLSRKSRQGFCEGFYITHTFVGMLIEILKMFYWQNVINSEDENETTFDWNASI